MVKEFIPTPTKETFKQTANEYFKKWNFPNCVGSIDGKHVKLKNPNNCGSDFYNYKGYFSTVLLAVADANYKFSVVDIGAKGSQSDGGILGNSKLGQQLFNGTLVLPEDCNLPGTYVPMPHVFLGDDAFPLRINLLRPYPGKSHRKPERIFNYRLSRARRVVENAFGIWAARFRIFHTTIHADLDLADLIVKGTVVLHNFLMCTQDMGDLSVDREEATGRVVAGSWRGITSADTGIEAIGRFGTNNRTKLAEITRNTYKTYFNSSLGAVGWQNEAINK
jgi:hypothetical protein